MQTTDSKRQPAAKLKTQTMRELRKLKRTTAKVSAKRTKAARGAFAA